MEEFIRMIRMMRFCHIGGRYGGGKTTLALCVADRLVKSGAVSRVCVNTPLNVGVPYMQSLNEVGLLEINDCVFIIDEAGQFLDSGSANSKILKQWFSYLRKRNQLLLMPSVLPVLKYAASFRCQRIFNGLQMGIPVWIYRWRLGLMDSKDAGWFMWWNPQQVFDLFDTDFEPDGSWYVYDFSNEAIERGSVGADIEQWASAQLVEGTQKWVGEPNGIYSAGNSRRAYRVGGDVR